MSRVVLACVAAVASAAVASGQVVLPPNLGVPAAAEVVPTAGLDLAGQSLAAADYAAATNLAAREYQGSVKVGGQRWIDSIASAAMLGECHYEQGSLAEAVASYEESMFLMAAYPDWILAVQFPPQPPRQAQRRRAAAWGRSARGASPAALPEVVPIRQGAADPQAVLQRGGVLAAPHDRPVRAQEIARCLVIAIYRHGSILGDLARESAAVAAVGKTLARRPAPPKHYSQAWIDVALGVTNWSQGRSDLARPLLESGLSVGNGLDHPLTPWALIVLGRILLDADDAQAAAKLFEEATYSAADFGDARAIEEAFRWAYAAHQAAGTRGVPAAIRGGCDWARGTLPALRWQLLGYEAECLAAAGDARAATTALREIDTAVVRGAAGRSRIAAQAAFAAATIGYVAGDVSAADADMERALAIARPHAPRLFQTARLTEAVTAGAPGLTDRLADTLFTRLLADPAPRDFALDPLGILATVTAPRAAAFEAWLSIAGRRDDERAIEVAEALVRNRWLESQPLGGRRLAAARLLSADPRGLAADAAARRAAVLGARRELADAVDRVARLRGDLGAALAAAGPEPDAAKADWAAYQAEAGRLARFVAALAAGREGIPLDFPPLTATAEIRRRLEPRQLILSFHWTRGGLVGLLESRERFAVWRVRQAADLPAAVKALARGLCLFEGHAAVATDRLAAGEWPAAVERIERIVFENSRIALGKDIDELVIVPDGWLWYVPFELLPVATNRAEGAGGEVVRLRDTCRLRYAPTRSLAVMETQPLPPGLVGVVAGRMSRADRPQTAEEAFAHLAAAIDRVVPLPAAAFGLSASTVDTLVVFEELSATGPSAARPLIAGAAGKHGVSFAEWLAPPPKRVRRCVLPGMQTAMADGFQSPPERPGDEAFSAAMDLLAAGAQTAVLSRWRTGGKTAMDLVTEFVRDATGPDGQPAAESWRRAVDVVLAEQFDPQREPRLRHAAPAAVPHPPPPLLWAGYMLIDCGAGPAAAAGQPPQGKP